MANSTKINLQKIVPKLLTKEEKSGKIIVSKKRFVYFGIKKEMNRL